jgi:CDP-diacylglycerol---glycerol-3-phosphate 3-phosphatidyltransferase
MRMKTRFGLYLDPIADKLLISSVLITLSCYGLVPLWLTLVIVSRELLINGLRSFYAVEGVTIYSSFAGKLKTTLQIVGISCVLYSPSLQTVGLIIIYGALFFSLFSAYKYVYAIFQGDATG